MVEAKERTKEKIVDPDAPPDTSYRGKVDPVSMVISPQEKIPDEPELAPMIGGPGDPRAISPFASDTPIYGTETPYRKTPPTNIGSAAEAAATTTPPTGAGVTQAQADSEPSPVAAVPPTIAGTTTSGSTLTCTPAPSPWVPAASSYQYQWYRSDEMISGATAATRVLAAADVGHRMKCRVTGVHATYGGSSPAFTAETAVVT
jgi:hypothetical protein